jgi:hypothetical protein
VLDLSVFAEGSVQRDKGQLDALGQFEIVPAHIHFRDFRA